MAQRLNVYGIYLLITFIFTLSGFIFVKNGLWGHLWVAVTVFQVISMAVLGYANFTRNHIMYKYKM